MVRAGVRNGYLLLLFIIFSVVLNEIVLMGNDLIAQAADKVLSGHQVDFTAFMVPLMWMIVLGTAAAYLKSISGSHYSAVVQRDVRASLGRHLMKLPFSYFDEKSSGSVITRLISDMDELGRFFSEILPNLLANIIVVVISTIYLVQLDALLIVVLFASYPIMLVVADRLSKKLAEITKRLRTHMDECNEKAYDAIQGIVIGRSYNLYELQKKEIDAVVDRKVEQACKSTRISSMGWVLKNVITTIPVIICYLFALYETMQGRITVGEMLAFTVILGRILYPIGDIVFCANDIREVGVSLKRLQEIYDQKEESAGGDIHTQPQDNEEIAAIEWKDVTFRYDNSEAHPVLNGMSFLIEKGEQTAFVGGSGEGKTTIFKLLCGFYEKNSGQYKLFGHSFEEWDLEAARSCFSEVSQNVFLFPETIRQNVACGKENATFEEVVEACKNANIHDFIQQLPEGYETLVG
ncbi:MAG: ABC transporter ATP-binding protein/permease, partial [Lachnospiraceae bacterium]|nr:ABC transporter ATP-binding protein/permease [Lachnospiraceae bacterium]